MTPATCKKLMFPQFVLTIIWIQVCSFAILAWGYRASLLDHFLVAKTMIGMEVLHYYLLYAALKHKLESKKILMGFQIAELLIVIPFVVFLILIMLKDWPITWIHLYVAIIQTMLPISRVLICNHIKRITQ